MPNRLIRDGILDSDRYWSVSIEARQMYFHMLLLADDLGCIGASATFLRRRCFNDQPSHERIAKLLNELQDVDLIRLYEVDRACYAFIPRFRQRLQRNTLKHPTPPFHLLEGDEHAQKLFKEINEKKEIPTVGQRVENRENALATVGQPPEVKRREEKRKEENLMPRAARLKPDWSPEENVKFWASQKRPDLNIEETIEEFRDYWLAKPGRDGTKLDRNLTFKTWVRNARAKATVNTTPQWWTSESATLAYGASKGIHPRPGEEMNQYRERLRRVA